jgi:hypothetical protein
VELFRTAAEAALAEATPLRDNAFKVELAKRTIVRALVTMVEQGTARVLQAGCRAIQLVAPYTDAALDA